jgi:hypothetical protein
MEGGHVAGTLTATSHDVSRGSCGVGSNDCLHRTRCWKARPLAAWATSGRTAVSDLPGQPRRRSTTGGQEDSFPARSRSLTPPCHPGLQALDGKQEDPRANLTMRDESILGEGQEGCWSDVEKVCRLGQLDGDGVDVDGLLVLHGC